MTVPLTHALRYTYRADLDHGLIEHEVDHVFVGRFDGAPSPSPDEVSEWRWVSPEALARELAATPERFTAWFRLLIPRIPAPD